MSIQIYKFARSARTGRFIKKSYANRHPNTTVVETIKRGTRKKKK